MFPGASLPNAMAHLSPDENTEGWTYCSGYAYSENTIMGFSHTHWSGVGMVNGGEILLMPYIGNKLHIIPGSPKNPDEGYRSRFDHKDESASLGYYSVLLKDYNIKVELTVTQRSGFQRYTFPEANNARVILDIGHQIGKMSPGGISNFKIINNKCIEGAKSDGSGYVYFVAEFSKPFKYYGIFDASYVTPESEGSIFPYKNAEAGTKIGAFVNFDTEKNEQILVRVGISYTSVEGAEKNLAKEIPNWDFDKTKDDARAIWSKELSKIEISGDNEDNKQIFYTAVYHSLLAQYISQEVDGSYFGSDGNIYNAKDHDIQGLINLFGNDNAFIQKLDSFFEMSPIITPPKYVGVVGTIGQYVQGNQPLYHVAYLYNYAGQPWKTPKWSRKIMNELYRTGPGGLCGNEDMGSLSSWYVLSAMGLYSVTPCSNQYVIGSPLFKEVKIYLNKGKTFTIKGKNNSKENIYIQSATFNGKKFNRTYIGYDEITNGDTLIFEMRSKPNKKWGITSDSRPYSMTKK